MPLIGGAIYNNAVFPDPKFCKQLKNCLTQLYFGCLHNFESGKTDVIVYSATYKNCSLKLN